MAPPKVGRGVKTEAEYFEQRGLPAPGVQPHEKVTHGLCLPLHLARALFRDPVARTRYLWVCTLQFLVIFGLGLLLMKADKVADDAVGHPAPPARPLPPPAPGAEEDEDEKEARAAPVDPEDAAKMAQKRATVETVASTLRAFGLDAQVREDPESGRISMKVEDGKRPAPVPPMPPLPAMPRGPEQEAERAIEQSAAMATVAVEELKAGRVEEAVRHAEAAARHVEVATEQLERGERMRNRVQARMRSLRKSWREATFTDLEFWAALLTAMHIVQWVVIALTRDYHDAISRDVSLLTRLEPEDGPEPPRIRLNLRWLRAKMRRRWRALMLFFMGAPFLWFITLPLPAGRTLFTALMSVWGAGWYVVFTAAKSSRAWKDEAAPMPLFLRGWTWLTQNIPGFRWALPRRYGSGMEKLTRDTYAPIACVEQQPWAYAGLAMLRAIGMIPGLKVFVRPFIPVASAHLLEARQAAFPTALPAPATLVPALEPAAEPVPAKVASGT